MNKLPPILFAINDLSFGGGQKTVAREVNTLFKRGYPVYVLTLLKTKGAGFGDILAIPPERIFALDFRGMFDWDEFKKLKLLLKGIQPEVIFSNLFFTNTLIRLASIVGGVLSLICIREGNIPIEKSGKVKFIDWLLSFVTEAIIVNAEMLRDEFQKIGIPNRKIRVLYNGIDPEFFSVEKDETRMLRGTLDIPQETFLFLTVASFTEKKGHMYLLYALSAIREEFPDADISLLLVGGGELQGMLERLAEKLGIADRVHFFGSKQNVPELYGLADAAVLPSLWEGLPNALLEALAAGCPSIATAVGGVPEILVDEQNGLLVPPANFEALKTAMLCIYRDENLRAQFAKNARESMQKYSWDAHADELIKIIERDENKSSKNFGMPQ